MNLTPCVPLVALALAPAIRAQEDPLQGAELTPQENAQIDEAFLLLFCAELEVPEVPAAGEAGAAEVTDAIDAANDAWDKDRIRSRPPPNPMTSEAITTQESTAPQADGTGNQYTSTTKVGEGDEVVLINSDILPGGATGDYHIARILAHEGVRLTSNLNFGDIDATSTQADRMQWCHAWERTQLAFKVQKAVCEALIKCAQMDENLTAQQLMDLTTELNDKIRNAETMIERMQTLIDRYCN